MKNFLNKEQTKELKKHWDVRPKGFYITIYKEDMSNSEWEQVCQNADVSTDIDELTILSFGIKK